MLDMQRTFPAGHRTSFLGIECGATKTSSLLADDRNEPLAKKQTGTANLRLLDDRQLVQHFRAIASGLPKPTSIAIGMAGARSEADRKRIRAAAGRVWPGVPCYATGDLETALMTETRGR